MADCKAAIILGEKSICENCLKSDVCKHKASIDKDPILEDVIERCEHFKDRSKFVELPCNLGTEVYSVQRGRNKNEYITVNGCTYERSVPTYYIVKFKYTLMHYSEGLQFGKDMFLTKEEAEKALTERGKK